MATLALVAIGILLLGHHGQGQEDCVDCVTEGSIKLYSPVKTNESRPFVQYCFNGTWSRLCQLHWSEESAKVVCRQLGYSDEGTFHGLYCDDQIWRSDAIRLISSCNGAESRLEECGVEKRCVVCDYVWVECQPVCSKGEVRLINGTTDKEGRVEVCIDGRWGAVCGNGKRLAEAVCSQLGLPDQGADSVAVNMFGPSTLPFSSCTVQNGSSLNCTIIDASCDPSMELAVVCEELFENCTRNASGDTKTKDLCTRDMSTCTVSTIIPILSGVIGVLVAVLFGMVTTLIVTCGALKRSKQRLQEAIPDSNNFKTAEEPTTASNPVYELFKRQDQAK